MKVGIITFHRAINYGAVFQTYALCKYINNKGIDCKVIDYRCNEIEKIYNPQISYKNLKKFILDLMSYKTRKQKKLKFENFISEKIPLIDIKNVDDMDILIAGSDQVWNYKITNFDKNYFLCFAKSTQKKISYAACMGITEIPSEIKEEYEKLLSSFDEISVRDNFSYDLTKTLYNKKIEKVLDPTFLLKIDEWKDICEQSKYDNYIVVFSVGYSEILSNFAIDLGKKKNLKVIFLNSGLRKIKGGIYLDTASPSEVLGLLLNASYVVTNSFHGTAMSLIFNKEFFVELNHDKKGRNYRVENMLKQFDVRNREILRPSYNDYDFQYLNYSIINKNIQNEREKSIKFLKNIFMENK